MTDLTIGIQLKNIVFNHITSLLEVTEQTLHCLLPSQQRLIKSQQDNKRAQPPLLYCYFSDFELVFTGWLQKKDLLN